MKCKCEDWKDNQPVIDTAITLLSLRGYGKINKSFTFCPWCGKKIK